MYSVLADAPILLFSAAGKREMNQKRISEEDTYVPGMRETLSFGRSF